MPLELEDTDDGDGKGISRSEEAAALGGLLYAKAGVRGERIVDIVVRMAGKARTSGPALFIVTSSEAVSQGVTAALGLALSGGCGP